MKLFLQVEVENDIRRLILSSSNNSICLSINIKNVDQIQINLNNKSINNLSNVKLLNENIFGTLGLIKIGSDSFLSVVTASSSITSSTSQSIEKINSVQFYCLTSSAFDTFESNLVDSVESYSYATDLLNRASDRTGDKTIEHPCAGIKKILSNDRFYYSSGENAFDLSTRLMERIKRKAKIEQTEDAIEYCDSRFIWNRFLLAPLIDFRNSLTSESRSALDRSGFLVMAIQGYAGVSTVTLDGQQAALTLISRVGHARSGTRFNTRGINDDGDVANFVETETILRTPTMCLSYVQVRGSVPLFWEEGGQPFGQIEVTRPVAATLPAFSRHFESLIDEYSNVHVLNLLSSRDQEALLTSAFENNLRSADNLVKSRTTMTAFDFHARTAVGGIDSLMSQLLAVVGTDLEQIASSLVSIDEKGVETLLIGQRGIMRTNCKDSLDRTNVTQDILSRFVLQSFVRNTFPSASKSDSSLWNAHRSLFASNGDALSSIYVGTGALNSSYTRSGKKSFAGLISNATKSVSRVIQSTMLDGAKQKSIDTLLGRLATSTPLRFYNPMAILAREQLLQRSAEFTSYNSINLWIGTYNLNGKSPQNESLLPWLFPPSSSSDTDPAFLVIGFQEIVPLSPQQIMITDPLKLRLWEARILKTITDRPDKKAEYIILRSEQLVGTALIVLARLDVAPLVRNIEATTKKTGLKGIAGNKGAVAIRLDYMDTSFCFITAHLAAGHSNVEERNADYFTISRGLHFQRGRSLVSHDNIIWAADTNYRIDLENEVARDYADRCEFGVLGDADQLGAAMREKGVFEGYSEGPLVFKPTYKYDNGTDVYDSSEKQRIPAYTDRILISGQDLDLIRYSRAELYSSDHRPVFALLRSRIKSIDRVKKSILKKEISLLLLASTPSPTSSIANGTANAMFDASLPPPSSDTQSWRDEEGKGDPLNVSSLPLSSPVKTLRRVPPPPPPRPSDSVDLIDFTTPVVATKSPPVVPPRPTLRLL